ncbi:MAG: hypothetical protein M1819_005165 [Sarea resinae]|nr:MAG: hypothetical protein M1819_005165 [Sarea resinae]
MGWWWSSSPAAAPEIQPLKDSLHAPESTPSIPQTNPSPRTPDREEQAEAEFRAFISQLGSESTEHSTTRTSRTDGSDPTPSAATSINADSLYPTEMSCRQAFDQAFYCQSPGGQFMNLYRYGNIRPCSELWSQFWFCMRTKSQPEEKKKVMIQEHYRQRAVKYKVGPSSEDVWEARTEPVLGAFSEDPDAVE